MGKRWISMGSPGWVALLLVLATALALGFMFGSEIGTVQNVGFLIFGTVIATSVSLLAEVIRRPVQANDLARAVHVELAEFVARCCFDLENPWGKFLEKGAYRPREMPLFRLNKFLPAQPVVYNSTASQLSLLKHEAPQALAQFYFRLSAWERDTVSLLTELRAMEQAQADKVSLGPKPAISAEEARFLAIRLRQTLAPGLKALSALGPMVNNAEKIEDAAIAAHDEISRPGISPRETSLRRRIALLI